MACVPPRPVTPGASSPELVAEARARGLSLEDPMELDADMAGDVDHAIGRRGEPRDRLHKLVRYLNDRGIGFKQLQGVSLPVKRAFHERRGDCMTYAMLFVALSRHIGLETYFVHASEVRAFYERDDTLFASSHIAVGYGHDPGYLVVDFYRERDDWEFASYRRIDDASAISLYFNNVAVYAMNAGKNEEAANLLTFLLDKRPNLAELHNNLAVVKLREHEYEAALGLTTRGITLFPSFKPLYTNAILAAYGAHKPELARELELRGQALVANDPLFVFARGLQYYKRSEFSLAAEHFERALASQQDSFVIVAWLVRAHLSAGHRDEGFEAFARARKLAPDDPRLKELEERFPELRDVR